MLAKNIGDILTTLVYGMLPTYSRGHLLHEFGKGGGWYHLQTTLMCIAPNDQIGRCGLKCWLSRWTLYKDDVTACVSIKRKYQLAAYRQNWHIESGRSKNSWTEEIAMRSNRHSTFFYHARLRMALLTLPDIGDIQNSNVAGWQKLGKPVLLNQWIGTQYVKHGFNWVNRF